MRLPRGLKSPLLLFALSMASFAEGSPGNSPAADPVTNIEQRASNAAGPSEPASGGLLQAPEEQLPLWNFFLRLSRREHARPGAAVTILTKGVGLEPAIAERVFTYMQAATSEQSAWSAAQKRTYCANLTAGEDEATQSAGLSAWGRASQARISSKISGLSRVIDAQNTAKLERWIKLHDNHQQHRMLNVDESKLPARADSGQGLNQVPHRGLLIQRLLRECSLTGSDQ